MNDTSRLYQPLTPEELSRIICAAFPNERITDSRLLEGGLFNTTYRVKTDAHDVVLRMGPIHTELLLPFEENLMAAEERVDALCLSHGVPASKVLRCDTSRRLIDRDYMIVERIESMPLSDPSIPESAKEPLFTECGELTRKLHAITGEQFGRLSEILRGRGCSTWSEAVLMEFRNLFHTARRFQVFSETLEKRALTLAQKARPVLDKVNTPHLAHADLWAGNVLVGQNADGGYGVRAIIDGDRAVFGDTAFDLDSPWMVNDAFLNGYGAVSGAFTPEEAACKRRVYRVLFALTDAFVWRVEYCNEDNHLECIKQAETVLTEAEEL